MFIGCGGEQAFVRKDDWVGRRGSWSQLSNVFNFLFQVARRREEEAERGQEGVKPAKTSELYIENETFSENGGNDHNSATETNGKYDNCENDFDKTENDLVSSTDSLDGELGDEDEDEEEDVVKVTSDASPSDLAVLLREGNRFASSSMPQLFPKFSNNSHHIL